MDLMDFTFHGYTRSSISFLQNATKWKIEMLADPNKYATTHGTIPPFGTKEYLLSAGLGSGNVALNLNACNDDEEFNCDDGRCIPIQMRCNSKFDCVDGSDEVMCHMIEAPVSYLKHVPDKEGAAVLIHVDIASVLAISEVAGIFKVKFQLTMVWQDKRLTFRNLKNNSLQNIVSEEEAKSIWSPVIVFENTQNMDQTEVRIRKPSYEQSYG